MNKIHLMTETFDLDIDELHDGAPEDVINKITALDKKGAGYQYLMVVLMGHGGKFSHFTQIE